MVYVILQSSPLVIGRFRSCFYDIQKNKVYFLPSKFAKILKKHNKKNHYNDLKTIYNDNVDLFEYYEQILLENEIIFHTNAPSQFCNLPTEWFEPSHVTNVILKIDNKNLGERHFQNLFNKIDLLGCQAIEFRILDQLEINDFKLIAEHINRSKISSFYLVFFDNWYDISVLKNIAYLSPKIININIYNSNTEKVESINISKFYIPVSYHSKPVKNYLHNPVVSLTNLNLKSFTESKNYNLYFNRKLIINPDGSIFDFTSQNKKNIFDLSIDDIKKKNYTKYWKIHKDLIDVCKDCEFRYMCVDSRIPVLRKDKSYYYPQECNYNPYIAKWKGEKGFHSLEECGVYVNDNDMKIDNEKLLEIQNEIWGNTT